MERFSKNRQAILDCLRSTDVHPTAEWIYARLKPEHPSLSLGTVYRNLCKLKDAGTILSMGVIAGQEHFDGNTAAHTHAMCTCCGRIVDLPITASLAQLMRQTGKDTGFHIEAAQFIGLCPDCRSAENH